MSEYRAVLSGNHEHSDLFKSVFGKWDVPILSPETKVVFLEGIQEEQACYFVDLDALTGEEMECMVQYLSQVHGALEDQVTESLDYHGLPLRADRVVCVMGNPVRKF